MAVAMRNEQYYAFLLSVLQSHPMDSADYFAALGITKRKLSKAHKNRVALLRHDARYGNLKALEALKAEYNIETRSMTSV